MSWFKTGIALSAAVLLFLPGCDFKPALGGNVTANHMIGSTQIDVKGNYRPDEFAEVLHARYGYLTNGGAYRLTVDLQYSDRSSPIQGSGGLHRYNVSATATGVVLDLSTGEVLLDFSISDKATWTSDGIKSTVSNTGEANAGLGVGEVLNNLNAREDAQYRLYKLLADRIYTRTLVIQKAAAS